MDTLLIIKRLGGREKWTLNQIGTQSVLTYCWLKNFEYFDCLDQNYKRKTFQ